MAVATQTQAGKEGMGSTAFLNDPGGGGVPASGLEKKLLVLYLEEMLIHLANEAGKKLEALRTQTDGSRGREGNSQTTITVSEGLLAVGRAFRA
jgi:hypothetical protein